MFDLILLTLPFVFLSLAFGSMFFLRFNRIIPQNVIRFVLLILAFQGFSQIAIMINGYRNARSIMSPQAVEISDKMEAESGIKITHLYLKNEFVIVYSAAFLLPFFVCSFLFYRKNKGVDT